MNKYDRSLLYIIVRPIVNVLFKIVFHPHIEGLENIPDGACIEVGNHTSILDPLLLMSANKRELHFLAKKELFTGFKGILFSNLGLIPVIWKVGRRFLYSQKERRKREEALWNLRWVLLR